MKHVLTLALCSIALSSPTFAQTLDTLEGVYRAEMGSKDQSAPLVVRVTKGGAVLQVSPPGLAHAESGEEIPLDMRKNGTRFGEITEKDSRFKLTIPKQRLNLFVPSDSSHMSFEFGIQSAPVRKDKKGDLKVGLFDPYHFVKLAPEEVKAASDFEKSTSDALKGKRWLLEESQKVDKDGKEFSRFVQSPFGTGYGQVEKRNPESLPKCKGIEFQSDGKASILVEDVDTKELRELAKVAYLIDAFQKHLVVEHPYLKTVEGKPTREYTRFCVDVSAVQDGGLVLKETPLNTVVDGGADQLISNQYRFKASDAK